MFFRIASIITPVVLIIFAGWVYGRRAHPDMSGINKATLDVIAPMLVVSAFVSKDFELLEQWSGHCSGFWHPSLANRQIIWHGSQNFCSSHDV